MGKKATPDQTSKIVTPCTPAQKAHWVKQSRNDGFNDLNSWIRATLDKNSELAFCKGSTNI